MILTILILLGLIYSSAFLASKKGKVALFSLMAILAVLANIFIAKTVAIGVFEVTLVADILFAGVYLISDILNERYGRQTAVKAVKISALSVVLSAIVGAIALSIQGASQEIDAAYKAIFEISIRASVASVVCFYLFSLLNTHIFDKLKNRFDGRLPFVRSSVSSIASNCSENFLFSFLAFYGVLPVPIIVSIAVGTTISEFIFSLINGAFFTKIRKA